MSTTAPLDALPQPAQRKKKYLFQVLAGRHWEPEIILDEDGKTIPLTDFSGRPILDRKGQPKPQTRDVKFGPGCPAGDIVESDIELDKLHNHPNSIKFKRLGEDGQRDARAEELKVEREQKHTAQAALRSALEKMPRAELVAWAEEQEIDLRGANKREDVLRTVLATLG